MMHRNNVKRYEVAAWCKRHRNASFVTSRDSVRIDNFLYIMEKYTSYISEIYTDRRIEKEREKRREERKAHLPPKLCTFSESQILKYLNGKFYL